MRTLLALMLFVFMLPMITAAQKTVTAASVIASINNHTRVDLKDVEITGDLDFTKLDNMQLEKQNSSDKIYISIVTSPVHFTNCTFSGKVLGYVSPDAYKPYVKSNTVYNTNFGADVSF